MDGTSSAMPPLPFLVVMLSQVNQLLSPALSDSTDMRVALIHLSDVAIHLDH